ncbi:MAG: hypothetical protein RJA70_1067 [Pseudomonadota bacterium]|jgi:hypothetical protein
MSAALQLERGAGPGRGSIAERIRTLELKASRFDLDALVHALFSCGFDWQGIQFEGVRSLGPSTGPFIRSLRIVEAPVRLAIVSLNAGLLAGASALPSYFFEFARNLADPEDFINFLGFWDAVQLRDHAVSLLPELGTNPRVIGLAHLARMNKRSPMCLHTLFRGMFPEMAVSVGSRTFERERSSKRARVGSPMTGRLVLGSRVRESHRGITVHLHIDSESCEGVADWEVEAKERLEVLEPILRSQRLPLEVVLRFEHYRYGHALAREPSVRRELGVRPWLSPTPGQSHGTAAVVVREPWAGSDAGF